MFIIIFQAVRRAVNVLNVSTCINIRPVRYSARIESVANARRQQLRTARQLRTAQSPKERDARLQQLRPAREQTIATESTEKPRRR